MWGTEDGYIHKTNMADINLMNIRKILLPISFRETAIYVHPTKPIGYVAGGNGMSSSSSLILFEVRIKN